MNMNVNANMKRVCIIKSYTWDDPMTSMECAWYTCYQYVDLDSHTISTARAYQGGSIEDALNKKVEVVPMTDEIRTLCYDIVKENNLKAAKADYERFSKEIEEYNKSLRPQKKGQLVQITSGKHKGKIGRITWLGKNTFKRSYQPRYGGWRAAAVMAMIDSRPYTIPAKDCDLVLVRPTKYGTTWEDGTEKCYIDISKCVVTEGFEPITLTLEDCKRFSKRSEENWFNYGGGYNVKTYI